MGLNPGRRPCHAKGIKNGTCGYWLPCLVLSIIRQALASLLITNIAQLTLQHLQKSPKKKSDDNQCLYSLEDCMEDWQAAVMLNTLSSFNIGIIIIV